MFNVHSDNYDAFKVPIQQNSEDGGVGWVV